MNFNAFLKEQSIRRPNDIALTFLPDRNQVLYVTNIELYQKVSLIASNLGSRTNKTPIILLFNPGLNFVVALLGCLASGNIAVPIAIPKPQQVQSVKRMIKNSSASIVLSEQDLICRYSKAFDEYEWIDPQTFSQRKETTLPLRIRPKDVAILQYTSGSTGTPKGVMVTYENLNHNIEAIAKHFDLSKDSVSFSWLPHYHDMGLIAGILLPLRVGCHGILTSPRQVIGRPEFWLDCITKYRVTHTGGPNFFFELCKEKNISNKAWDLRSLHSVYVSAEPVRAQTLEGFIKKFEPYGFSPKMFTPGYGLAEATLMVSCKKAGESIRFNSFESTSGCINSVSLGKLISEIEAIIVDPETSEIISDRPGELWLKGTSVTKGYWNNKKDTKNTYQVLLNNGKWLKTGDIGIFYETELYILGRLKDLIIINGTNYYAQDIEHTLMEGIATLERDACLAFPIEESKGEELIILIKIAKATPATILVSLKEEVRGILYHQFGLANASIYFHQGPAYAKTTSGKIRRAYNKTLFLKNTFKFLPDRDEIHQRRHTPNLY